MNATNTYRFSSVGDDEDEIADGNALAGTIEVDDEPFSSSSITCISNVDCTTEHRGKAYDVKRDGNDLLLQTQGQNRKIRLKDFESGDFGVYLPGAYRYTLGMQGLPNPWFVLSNGNILVLSGEADHYTPDAYPGTYPVYLTCTIYNADGEVVRPTSRLAEAVNTVGPLPFGTVLKPKALTLKNGNTVYSSAA